jgi:hypothetical protein
MSAMLLLNFMIVAVFATILAKNFVSYVVIIGSIPYGNAGFSTKENAFDSQNPEPRVKHGIDLPRPGNDSKKFDPVISKN